MRPDWRHPPCDVDDNGVRLRFAASSKPLRAASACNPALANAVLLAVYCSIDVVSTKVANSAIADGTSLRGAGTAQRRSRHNTSKVSW